MAEDQQGSNKRVTSFHCSSPPFFPLPFPSSPPLPPHSALELGTHRAWWLAPVERAVRERGCSSYRPSLFTQMVASFIIFVRGVEEVGKQEDWLNLQRLFISSRREGGREHWVKTFLACYTLTASPPPPPVNLSTPPLPRIF